MISTTEVEQVVVPVAVVDQHDEVGNVAACLRTGSVRYFQTQTLVLDVGTDLRMRLDDAAELRLPVAVAHHPVDVAQALVRLPAGLLGRGEVDVSRRAGGIVGIEYRLDRALAEVALHDALSDALTGSVGELLVHQLGRVGAALADQMVVQPAARDPLELAEQVELRFRIGVAPVSLQQCLGQMEHQGGRPQVLQVLERQIYALADDARVVGDRRSDDLGREHECRVIVELRVHMLVRQLHAVAL